MPGMPTPAPEIFLASDIFGELPDGVAHFTDDVVRPESGFCSERYFFKKLAVGADGGDAEVGAAEIDSDGKSAMD